MTSLRRTRDVARSSTSTNGNKICVSKRELEKMVEQEVSSAIKNRESSLDALIGRIQEELDQGLDYDASVTMLKTRMMEVTQKAERAIAHLEENTIQLVSTKTESEDPVIQVSSVSEFMEKTKKEFERLHEENAALKAAMEDIKERASPSPTISSRRPVLIQVKREPGDHPEVSCSPFPVTPPQKRSNEELCSEMDRLPKRIKTEPEEAPYPPLPALPFPSSLPLEAAKYSIPPRLKVDMALIKFPSPQLSLVWTLDEDEPTAPSMDTYSIYMTTERAVDSDLFEDWQKVAELTAMPLPMFYPSLKFRPGHKICVAVVGKDVFGRYGPYSEVCCATV